MFRSKLLTAFAVLVLLLVAMVPAAGAADTTPGKPGPMDGDWSVNISWMYDGDETLLWHVDAGVFHGAFTDDKGGSGALVGIPVPLGYYVVLTYAGEDLIFAGGLERSGGMDYAFGIATLPGDWGYWFATRVVEGK